MYGRAADNFEYRGVKFRWVLSPNRLIYRVYHGSDLIGTIPTAQVRLRHLPEAIEYLYPICDAWLENNPPPLKERMDEVDVPTGEQKPKKRATKKEMAARKKKAGE